MKMKNYFPLMIVGALTAIPMTLAWQQEANSVILVTPIDNFGSGTDSSTGMFCSTTLSLQECVYRQTDAANTDTFTSSIGNADVLGGARSIGGPSFTGTVPDVQFAGVTNTSGEFVVNTGTGNMIPSGGTPPDPQYTTDVRYGSAIVGGTGFNLDMTGNRNIFNTRAVFDITGYNITGGIGNPTLIFRILKDGSPGDPFGEADNVSSPISITGTGRIVIPLTSLNFPTPPLTNTPANFTQLDAVRFILTFPNGLEGEVKIGSLYLESEIPEPSAVISLISLGLLGVGSKLIKKKGRSS